MWCRSCQQDVPGVATRDQPERISCTRCGQSLSADILPPGGPEFEPIEEDEPAVPPFSSPFPGSPPLNVDSIQMDDDLRAAERLVRSVLRQTSSARIRRDDARPPASRKTRPTSASDPRSPLLSAGAKPATKMPWLILTTGVLGLISGVLLLGWATLSGRDDLWLGGIATASIGQLLLFAALALQLRVVGKTSHEVTDAIEGLDDRLAGLRRATQVLSEVHGAHARSFYAHFAAGASPHLLMADLQGQLDMLAERLEDK